MSLISVPPMKCSSCNSWTVPKVSWWGVAMHHTGPRWNVRCSIVTSDHVQLWTMRCLHIQPTVIWCLHTQPSLDWYDVIPSPQWYHVITSECQPAPTLYFTVYILGSVTQPYGTRTTVTSLKRAKNVGNFPTTQLGEVVRRHPTSYPS